jgi:hypothetical protein
MYGRLLVFLASVTDQLIAELRNLARRLAEYYQIHGFP